VIVTGCDDWEQRDKERFRQRFSQAFDNRLPMFHFASGKLGGKARKTGSAEELEQAGIPAIEERIKLLADTSGRMNCTEKTVLELAENLKNWYDDFRRNADVSRFLFWRPDSFVRWSAACQNNSLQNKLTEILTVSQKQNRGE
jgi:hypothetical protein